MSLLFVYREQGPSQPEPPHQTIDSRETKLCLVGSNIFMLGQEGRMWLLRTVFTHWTGSSGSEDALHVHTSPWSAPSLVACYSHLIAGSMGVRCVCASCIGQYSHECVAPQPHNKGPAPEPVNKPTYTKTGVHTCLIWETFLMVYQYLHAGRWVKWGRVDIVMRSNLHTLNQSNKIKQGQKVDLFLTYFLPHVANCFMKGTNSVSSVGGCPGVLWTVCSLTTLASGYCGIWIKNIASVPSDHLGSLSQYQLTGSNDVESLMGRCHSANSCRMTQLWAACVLLLMPNLLNELYNTVNLYGDPIQDCFNPYMAVVLLT